MEWSRKMVFEEEIEEMKKLEEEIRQQRIKKVRKAKKKKKSKKKNAKGIKVTCCMIGIIVLIGIVFSYFYYKEWKLNQEIVKNDNQKIELAQVQKMKLWNETIENIRENNKYIEVDYNNKYKVKLDFEKLANNNKFAVKVENKVSNYQEWKNQDILEMDVSQVQPYHLLEQIELNTNEWLKGWNKVDIYGIKAEDGKIEYIETKEIHEDNLTLVLREEYQKYILVYVPIQEIKVEEEIEMMKDELYQMQIKIEPSNATTKMIHIEDLEEGSIIQVKENGTIQAVAIGTTEFEIEAEQGKVKKKVKVTVKDRVEGMPTEPQQVAEQNKNDLTTVRIQNDESKVNATILDNYKNGVLIVNKNNPLPDNYDPGTNPEALQAFENMKMKAKEEGISLKIVSGYRSFQTQQSIYQRNVRLYGEEIANTFSAKPGQSEHQTGLAFDVNSTRWDFKDTVEAKWLAENCYNFGFIIRYPEDKQEITGYVYEPWHIRYVGNKVANEIKNRGVCLEEYVEIY